MMPTKTIDVREAQTTLNELLYLVREGAEVIFMEGSTPLAHLVPMIKPMTSRIAGLHAGAICMSDDFDEPLPEEYWVGNS